MSHFTRSIQKEVVFASYNCTMTGDEKWIYLENSKCKKSWVDPGTPSTSTARPNSFDPKTILCVWCYQRGLVNYELLLPVETINTKRYQQQLIDLNRFLLEIKPEKGWTERGNTKTIFFMTKAPSHTTKPIHDTLEALSREVLSQATYSPDLAHSDYHLFT